ncbi:C-type lectin domain family 4 member M-like [Asterias amurensis]|uniref:C-type lectin domain family 4 member M-like n=1 Tax=Asterias amurensis TaxID=7602 RepID=UPI003AB61372
MLASKLLRVAVIFMMANYAAVNGRCWKPCPPTWSQWQDKCYKVHDAEVTWGEGTQICVESGGMMVVPQSKEDLQHILNMFSCDKFLIGCNDIEVEGTWVCLDGEGLDVKDKRWRSGQPDSSGGNQDCAIFTSAGLFDLGCGSKRRLICQRPVTAM